MIPPLSLFNVSRYKRRETEKRVNKNVQMSALCHSAVVKLCASTGDAVASVPVVNLYNKALRSDFLRTFHLSLIHVF